MGNSVRWVEWFDSLLSVNVRCCLVVTVDVQPSISIIINFKYFMNFLL